MTLTYAVLLFVVLLLLLIFIKVPIGIALGVIGFIGFILYKVPLMTMAQQFYSGVDSFTWIAIPLFILAGSLMEKGGLSKRLINFADSIVGNIRGGLGITTVFASAFFAAISGSGPATTAAIGAVMIPEMKKRGYAEKFAAAIAASGGVLGVLIPPSITFIAYGVLAEVSVSKLFMAGVIPGIITAFVMMVVTYFLSGRYAPYRSGTKFSMKRVGVTFYQGFFSLMAPVIILGGIYLGIVTPTESAVLAVIYGIIIGFIYRELNLKELGNSMKATIRTTGTLAIIWAAAASYSYVLTLSGISQAATKGVLSISTNPQVVVVLLSVIVVIMGCFVNTMGMIILLTPIFTPILRAVGFDPIVFGVLFTMMCEIGFITPPVGTCLFVAKTLVEKTDVMEIGQMSVPYIIVLYIMIIFFIFYPQFVMYLPNKLM